MQLVYREITNVIDHRINLRLPDYITSEKVEIIILPVVSPKLKATKKVDYNKYFGISNIGISIIENQLKSIRNEWDRVILD